MKNLKTNFKKFWNDNETSDKDWELWHKKGIDSPPPIGTRNEVLAVILVAIFSIGLFTFLHYHIR